MLALHMTNQELTEAVQQQQSAPSAQLPSGLVRVVRSVIACGLHVSADAPEVHDAVQETLKRAAEKQRFDTAYVVGIAKYVALDVIRRRARARKREGELPEAEGSGPLPDASVEAVTGEALLEQKQLRGELQALITALPENQRIAFLKRELEGDSYEALAAHFDVPMGTIATWLSRARATLAKGLQNPSPDRTRALLTTGATR
jgi:RNA polymerase sigma-70 factor, ECF subfamily